MHLNFKFYLSGKNTKYYVKKIFNSKLYTSYSKLQSVLNYLKTKKIFIRIYCKKFVRLKIKRIKYYYNNDTTILICTGDVSAIRSR